MKIIGLGDRFIDPDDRELVVVGVAEFIPRAFPPNTHNYRVTYVYADESPVHPTHEVTGTELIKYRRPKVARPTVDQYFIRMAHLAAERATCDRKHVGAVLTKNGRTVGTGYNGSPPGMPHCDDVGHDFVTLADGSVNCVRTTHAEANAFLDAAANGKATDGTTLYTNTFPCWNCAKMILGAGVMRVVFDADYNNDPRVGGAFESKGVKLVRYKEMEVLR